MSIPVSSLDLKKTRLNRPYRSARLSSSSKLGLSEVKTTQRLVTMTRVLNQLSSFLLILHNYGLCMREATYTTSLLWQHTPDC